MNGEDTARLTAREKRIIKSAVEHKLPPSEIAERFGTTPGAVYQALHKLRKKGVAVERFHGSKGTPATTVRVSRRTMAQLRREAKRRGMSPRQLTERIITQVIKRGLVADLVDGGADERQ